MSAESKQANADWGDIENVPKQKRGVPKWLLFCGSGCLVVVVLGVIAAYFGMKFLQKGQDPDVQYPAFEESIALDHRLDGFGIFGWNVFGSEGFAFHRTNGQSPMVVFIVADTPKERQEFAGMLDPEELKKGGQFGEAADIEEGMIAVQGRQLRTVRAVMKEATFMPGGKSEDNGAAAFVDVSPEGGGDFVVMMYMRPGDKTRVTDEEVVEFLRPFHIGPEREPSVPVAPEEPPGDVPDDGR